MKDPFAVAERVLENGQELMVYPLLYGRARLGISRPGTGSFDNEW